MPNVFAPQVFFIVFRECLEAVIVISVLLSFLKKSLGQPEQDRKIYRRLVKQVWYGAIVGIVICLIIGGAFIGVFYGLGKDIWAESEDLWEGIFYLIATLIITAMGLALLRINKTQMKWRVKLAQALIEQRKKTGSRGWLGNWTRRYVMFILPLITTLREGVEAVVFVGGVSLGYPPTSFPIPVITGILAALIVGYLLYRGGNRLSIQIFLVFSTSVLYLIAAGMFSKSIWSLQYYVFQKKVGSDVAEAGNGPGSYNVRQTIWHVNCCNPETDNGWDVLNSILGWQNTATYGSIISYNMFWVFIIVCICCLLYEERTGSLPFKKQTVNVLLKVPGVNLYVRRKMAISQEDPDELVRQGEAHIREVQQEENKGVKVQNSVLV